MNKWLATRIFGKARGVTGDLKSYFVLAFTCNMASPLKIPHIKQSRETSCGAAVLAMVYQSFGFFEENETTIFQQVKSPRPNTRNEYYIRTRDMALDSKRLGLSYFLGQAVMGSPETALQPIKEFLSASIPVIVCQRIDPDSQHGHFRLVTGISGNKIHINDPLKDSPGELETDEFMKLWERTSEDEVIGGQFLAVFPKERVKSDTKLLVQGFDSSTKSFEVSALDFI